MLLAADSAAHNHVRRPLLLLSVHWRCHAHSGTVHLILLRVMACALHELRGIHASLPFKWLVLVRLARAAMPEPAPALARRVRNHRVRAAVLAGVSRLIPRVNARYAHIAAFRLHIQGRHSALLHRAHNCSLNLTRHSGLVVGQGRCVLGCVVGNCYP
jgi:hypothetical protein